MRASLDMHANIAACGRREQSDCDEAWIRADEQRVRQTEQMLVDETLIMLMLQHDCSSS
jgi:hypothetical protein